MVIFIPYVAPGDVVDVQLTKKKHSYAEGFAVRFQKYSDLRIEPFCEHFGTCGGCKWQHLPYEEQLRFKQKQVVDNLTRIGKIDIGEVKPILGSENIQFYRNKLEFTFSNRKWLTSKPTDEELQSNDMNALGFHIPTMFDKVLDIHKCWLQDDISNKIRLDIKDFCLKNEGYPFFDIRSKDIINSEFYYIQPNDVIYIQDVPEQFFSITSFGSALSTFFTTVSFGVLIYNIVDMLQPSTSSTTSTTTQNP